LEVIIEVIAKPSGNCAFVLWHMSGECRPSHSWLSNGYKIRSLSLEKGVIVFQRVEKMGVAVEIPSIFLSGRVPERAASELKVLIRYIMEKYGL